MLVGLFFFPLPSDLLHFLLVQHAELALLFPSNKHANAISTKRATNKRGWEVVCSVWAVVVLDRWERDPDTLLRKYGSDLFLNTHSAN